jgi:phenylalanyl-tRNA synthetase beta chain
VNAKYQVGKSSQYKVIIDKSVKKVRPYTSCAVIKGIRFTEENIKEVIDIQEKLHGSYGRNRKKLAIGVYPLEQIKFPVTFLAKKPEDILFQPLESPKKMNGRQILSMHPKGREYGHLLEDAQVFPIFQDTNKEILSMPPIINSEKTGKISEKTKDIFVECSGFNKQYLDKTLAMIVTTLADMGGKIHQVQILDKAENKKYNSPDLQPEKKEFSIDFLNKNLGTNFSEKEIKKLLEKMRITTVKEKKKTYGLIPSYRTDILHEIDLAEELAIAYGYENFKPEIPHIGTIGEEQPLAITKRKIAEILIGAGLLETSSYHLSTKEKQFDLLNISSEKKLIEVVDSKTERAILRNSLLANSIQILKENTDAAYPQKIFELGRIFTNNSNEETGITEKEMLCISLCHEKANFTEIKQVLDYLMKLLDKTYEINEATHPAYIDGRCGEIIVNKKSIGYIGEIHPSVLKNNKIGIPTACLEIEIDWLI